MIEVESLKKEIKQLNKENQELQNSILIFISNKII